ncbi:MAG: hypothetical protein KBC30_11180 [Planctomycetes bacterium]|nr:hypothetical protein [Planctomycetota bacterium]HNZ67013.1 hypothetical protein [Planctomycetota bacterium]HPY75071.1 hypothetical protein [Planctomycetota bacterium]HQB00732.1 hypothetical protein [Planctomycetota bacterium]
MNNHNDAILICSRLLREGHILKQEFPQLEFDDELMNDVQKRLQSTGTELITTTNSPYYAVRFLPEVQEELENSNNLGMRNNEIAMLVILWSKLILPKRITSESQMNTQLENLQKKIQSSSEQKSFEEIEQKNIPNAEDEEKIFVKISELWVEFGEHFGTKTSFRATLTRLSNLQFIRIHNEIVTEGIFLDLLINSQTMAQEIKHSALAYKLAGLTEEEEEEEMEEMWDDEDEVF